MAGQSIEAFSCHSRYLLPLLIQSSNSFKLEFVQGRWEHSHLCCWFTFFSFVIGEPWSGVTNLRGAAMCVCVCVFITLPSLWIDSHLSFNWSNFSRTNRALERGEIAVIVPWEETRKSKEPKKKNIGGDIKVGEGVKRGEKERERWQLREVAAREARRTDCEFPRAVEKPPSLSQRLCHFSINKRLRINIPQEIKIGDVTLIQLSGVSKVRH